MASVWRTMCENVCSVTSSDHKVVVLLKSNECRKEVRNMPDL